MVTALLQMTSPQLFRHLVILEDGRSSKVFQLDTAKGQFRIGREKKSDYYSL